MTKESLSRKSKEELLALARQAKIAGCSTMTKVKLIAALLKVAASPSRTVSSATRSSSKKAAPSAQRIVERQAARGTAARGRRTTKATVAAAGGGMASAVSTAQAAAESKFYLGERAAAKAPPLPATGPQERESATAEPRYELPHRYGDHRIVAMVRDPWWLYVYWEVDPGREQALRATIARQGEESTGSWLRIYDVTDIEFTGANALHSWDIELAGLADNWYVHVEQPNRSYIIEIGIKSRSGRFYMLARSNRVTTPRSGPSDQVDAEWMCPDDDFWRLFGMAGGFGVGRSSMEMKEMFERRWQEELSSGAVSSLSSPGLAQAKARSFWMWVKTELVVYGATEPDAQVTVQGRPIRLRPDGTFSLRFALPDGRQEIPVCATSADDRETRAVTPIVTRKTR